MIADIFIPKEPDMAKQVIINLQSITLELSDAEFRAVKEGNGLSSNEVLKELILQKVKANLDEGNGVEYAEEL